LYYSFLKSLVGLKDSLLNLECQNSTESFVDIL